MHFSFPERRSSIYEWQPILKQGSRSRTLKRFPKTCFIAVGCKVLSMPWGLWRQCYLIVSCDYYARQKIMRKIAHLPSSGNCFRSPSHSGKESLHLCWIKPIHQFGKCVYCCEGRGPCKVCRLMQTPWVIFIREAIAMFILFPLSVSVNIKMK